MASRNTVITGNNNSILCIITDNIYSVWTQLYGLISGEPDDSHQSFWYFVIAFSDGSPEVRDDHCIPCGETPVSVSTGYLSKRVANYTVGCDVQRFHHFKQCYLYSSRRTELCSHCRHRCLKLMASTQYSLDRKDIYKELGVLGLDYGPNFQRLKRIQTNDFRDIYGINEWDGNFVTYLDAMLQSMVFAAPFRKLIVPVMIRTIRVDPRVLFDALRLNRNLLSKRINDSTQVSTDLIQESPFLGTAEARPILYSHDRQFIERFAKYSAEMPFYFDAKCCRLVAHGLEVEGVIAQPIPRHPPIADLVLDSYQFVANEDHDAISSVDTQMVCKSMAIKVKQMGFKEMKCDFNYQSIADNVIEEYRNENNENRVLFRIFDKLLTEMVDYNKNMKNSRDMTKVLNEIQEKPEYDLSKDMINQIQKNERLIRSLVDIVCENVLNINDINVTEINVSGNILAKEVEQIISFFKAGAFHVNYSLVVKSKQNIIDVYKSKAIEWDSKDDLPLKPSHLFTDPEIAFMSLMGDSYFQNSILKTRITEFTKLSTESGLKLIATKYDGIGTVAILFRKMDIKVKVPQNDNIIKISGDYQQWFGELQRKLRAEKESNHNVDNVWLVANDSCINGIIEPGGENCRYIFHMDTNTDTNIDFNTKPYSDILANDLVANVIKGGKVGTYRHIALTTDSDKVFTNDYYLNLGQTRELSGLQWYDLSTVSTPKHCYDFVGNEVTKHKIHIYSAGIIFHDVMVATGQIPIGPEAIYTECIIGGEFAGRRADTGERVMGIELGRCVSTFVNVASHAFSPIPDHWSMDEAVSILSTYSTTYYGLIRKGRLQRGESILIHSAAGGVGQAAMNVCKHYECDIYATVGTEEKKQFLMNEYNIPENKIFNSRDILFKSQIMEATEGKGVDVVLNSLSGEKLVATYECVANSGRIVEMGRYDMVQNRKLGMFDFVRDIDLICVVLDLVVERNPKFLPEFFDWVHKNITNGCVKPINQTVFPAAEAVNA
ncbi:unnamed protein product, partial [Medioppia subpectinata]